jgi:metallo-beta-lactamase class B
MLRILPALASLLLLGATTPAPLAPTNEFAGAVLAKACDGKDGWDEPAPPAHLFGNTWYVGTCGITALLVTSPAGHVLVDTGTAKAAPLVIANIRRAGFKPHDVRWIVSSHEHHDHVGGLAALAKATGARIAALPAAAAVLRSGRTDPDDPQAAIHPAMAPVRVDRVLPDGGTVRIGPLRLRAVATPAHSPGSTSWTWQSCAGRDCRTITYADSATAVSADSYRFADHPARIAAVRQGLERIGTLPCGILITPHPAASSLFERLAAGPLVTEPTACRAYARAAQARFATRLAAEVKAP